MIKKHKYLRLSLIIGISVYTLIYFLSCLTPYISPHYFKGFTFLALGFPYLLIGMLVILLLSCLCFRRYLLPLLLLTTIGYKNIFTTTGFNLPKHFIQQKEAGTFRLLSWNVNDFVDSDKYLDNPKKARRVILSFIKSVNADVMCFQDFRSFTENNSFYSNLKYITDTLNYKYYYLSVDDSCNKDYFPFKYGTAIFSRYPIIDSGRYEYNWKHFPEHLMYADMNIEGKRTRIYNTHLRSMFLKRNGRVIYGNEVFVQDDTAMIFTSNRYQKIRYFDSIHVHQAELVKKQLNGCTLPYIFCADLNSVPSSYVYHHISKGLTDAFLQNGTGWSGTYSEIAPTLRIDVVLMNKDLKSSQYYSPRVRNASDHYPIVTDIAIH